MRPISSADATNESELTTKTVSRPKYAAITPPTANPIAKLNDHVVVEIAFAITISDFAVMFGITALRPGSNKAQRIVSQNSNTYSSQTRCGVRTNTMHSTMVARIQSAKIITFLRLSRSLI